MRPHRTDLTSLVAGLVFVAIALSHLLGGLDDAQSQLTYVWPGALIAVGLAILAGGRRDRRHDDPDGD